MKVRGVQFSPVLGDVSRNLDYHVEKIKQAVKDKIDLIVFPELSLCGYHLKDIVYDVALGPGADAFKILKELSQKIDIVVGAPYEEHPGFIYNCGFYFSGGELVHTHRKVQLPNFGMFEEQMIFKAGDTFRTFRVKEFNVGLLICREILFPVYAYLYYLQQADFIIAISNSPFRTFSKEGFASFKFWENMGYVYAVFYHQNYIFVNRTGFEDGIGFGGGSFFARPGKGIEHMAKYLEEDMFDVDVRLQDVRKSRVAGNYARDEKPEIVLKELKRILNA
jgi:NAD+ synthase (glutamine-hydrolysing)